MKRSVTSLHVMGTGPIMTSTLLHSTSQSPWDIVHWELWHRAVTFRANYSPFQSGKPNARYKRKQSRAKGRPFSIMLVKLAFNAARNSRIKPKRAKIMPDFFKKCHLNSKKCFVLFQTKRTNSYTMCSYNQQVILNNCLFIKLGIRI